MQTVRANPDPNPLPKGEGTGLPSSYTPIPSPGGSGIEGEGIRTQSPAAPFPALPYSPSPSGRGIKGEGLTRRLPDDVLEFARALRRQYTDAERYLWAILRSRRLANFKFRRQHPVGPYILDFYCHQARLAIELDGGQHNTASGKAYDETRRAFLAGQGIYVLRFWDNEVFTETEAALERIHEALTLTLSQRERG